MAIAPVLFGCQIAVDCHCYIVFGFQTSHQQIITILLQSEFFQKLRIVILVDISPIRQKLALLAILLFVIVMNAHVVGYQVMTVLHVIRSSQKTNFRTHLLNFVRLYSSPSMFVVNTGCLMFFTLNQMYAGTMEVYPPHK